MRGMDVNERQTEVRNPVLNVFGTSADRPAVLYLVPERAQFETSPRRTGLSFQGQGLQALQVPAAIPWLTQRTGEQKDRSADSTHLLPRKR